MYADTSQQPIVEKYGGSSVGTCERIQLAAKRVARQKRRGLRQIAVVVSAMSGETDRLVGLMGQVNPEAPPLHYDMAVAAGEQVSVALLAAALEREGIAAKGFLGHQLGIFTNDLHAKARIERIDCAKIRDCWERNAVPVIAGFQGVSSVSEITTLGRGGSDTSAVAVAVALDAAFCEINTDVDGVFSADPRVVPNARLAQYLDYAVALEMASLGSKVLHPRCVELGAKFSMPILVRNTFNTNNEPGTIIMDYAAYKSSMLEAPVVSAITLDKNVASITLDRVPFGADSLAAVLRALAEAGIDVDVIVCNIADGHHEMNLGFTVNRGESAEAFELLQSWKADNHLHDTVITLQQRLAKVSAVGLGIQKHPEIASTFFSALAEEGIGVHMVSTSELRISCVVPESFAQKATIVLHDSLVTAHDGLGFSTMSSIDSEREVRHDV